MWTLTLLVALSLVASVLANYGVVGPGAPSGEVPTIAHRLVARQAATFTGFLAGFGQAIPGFTQTNQRGWCWQNGAILPDENTETLNALSSGTNTYRVNGPYIRKYCDGQQLGLTNTQCIARLFRDYYNDLISVPQRLRGLRTPVHQSGDPAMRFRSSSAQAPLAVYRLPPRVPPVPAATRGLRMC
ncbi:hypothetical protein Q8F55_008414 [Vanrija albida]|uniref:Uncharacterized protein n=1 Tax=Vanrija albida TaxID=181172 RepID=A0ABR3PWB4_9TREE